MTSRQVSDAPQLTSFDALLLAGSGSNGGAPSTTIDGRPRTPSTFMGTSGVPSTNVFSTLMRRVREVVMPAAAVAPTVVPAKTPAAMSTSADSSVNVRKTEAAGTMDSTTPQAQLWNKAVAPRRAARPTTLSNVYSARNVNDTLASSTVGTKSASSASINSTPDHAPISRNKALARTLERPRSNSIDTQILTFVGYRRANKVKEKDTSSSVASSSRSGASVATAPAPVKPARLLANGKKVATAKAAAPGFFTSDFDGLEQKLHTLLHPGQEQDEAVSTLPPHSRPSSHSRKSLRRESRPAAIDLSARNSANDVSSPHSTTHSPLDSAMTPNLFAPKTAAYAISHLLQRIKRLGQEEEERRDYWLRDEITRECFQCKQPFTTFRRRHHCRICGQVFCNSCSSEVIPGERVGIRRNIRACDYCAKVMREYSNEAADDVEATSTYNPNNTASSQNLQHWLRTSSPNVAVLASEQQNAATTGALANNNTHHPPMSASITNIRRMFTQGSNIFSPKFWTGPQHGSSSEGTPSPQSPVQDLPFRTNVTDMFEEDPVGALDDSDADHSLTSPEEEDMYSHDDNMINFLYREQRPSLASFMGASSPLSTSTSSLPDIALSGAGGASGSDAQVGPTTSGSAQPRRGHRRRNTAATNLKYSAKMFREQLNLAISSSPGLGDSTPSLDHQARPLSASMPTSPTMLRRSGSFSSTTPDLPQYFIDHMRALLRQVLNELEITDCDPWIDVLISLTINVCNRLKPNIRSGDEIDVRHYVKIKRIAGGLPSDSALVQGVVCSKNVAHKRMSRTIKNPRILLLKFPLEYHRGGDALEFMSIEPVLQQEREYLRNVVNRIILLEPDVVLVEKTVARVALDYLLHANVVVALNVKPSVIEAVARCTQAEIVSSLDKITLRSDAKLGTCGSFYIKTFSSAQLPQGRKTFLFFDDCPADRGCTLLLRGGDAKTLPMIKKIADLLVFAAYHLKLEAHLILDQCSYNRRPLEDSPAVAGDQKEILPEESDKAHLCARLVAPFESRILSVSPFVHFPPPVQLSKMVTFEAKLYGDRMQLDESADAAQAELLQHTVDKLVEANQLFTDAIRQGDLQSFRLFGDYPLAIKNGLNYLVEHSHTIISPFSHQNIMVLYSNLCTVTALPCHPPEIHVIEYYRETDLTLGQYLEELCFDSSYICPSSSCQRSMLLHCRAYVHGTAQLSVLIEEFPAPISGMEATILMWSLCKICGAIVPVVPMSEWTWRMSFGKYLELSFYHRNLASKPESCGHDAFRDHIRYFGLRGLAVRFEYQEIDLLELVPPPMHTVIRRDCLETLKASDVERLRADVLTFYQSVSERLRLLGLEESATNSTVELRQALVELSKRIPAEKTAVWSLLQETASTSSASDVLALNSVRKVLYETCLDWDRDFADIARRYLLSERTDRRVTAGSQIRRLFMDATDAATAGTWSLTLRRPQNGRAAQATIDDVNSTDHPALLCTTTGLHRWHHSHALSAMVELTIVPKLDVMNDDSDNLRAVSSEHGLAAAPSPAKEDRSRLSDKLSVQMPRVRSRSRSRVRPPSIDEDDQDDELLAADDEKELPVREFFRCGVQSADETEWICGVDNDLFPFIDDEPLDVAETAVAIVPQSGLSRNSDSISVHSLAAQHPLELARELSKEPSIAPSDGERQSIMKTLRDLWGPTTLSVQPGQATSLLGGEISLLFDFVGFRPLDYPFSLNEHFVEFSSIVVREYEPSSIIAFALDSIHVQREVERMRLQRSGPSLHREKTTTSMRLLDDDDLSTAADGESAGSSVKHLPPILESRLSAMNANISVADGEADEVLLVQKGDGSVDQIEDIVRKGAGVHIKYEFTVGPAKCYCRVYFAEQFDALRRNCGCDEDFVASLSRCAKWNTSGGQSRSSFFKTLDDRYVMKQLSKPEMESFLRFSPSYFEYMSQTFFHDLPTVMAKLFGVYRISYRHPQTNRVLKVDVLVMENLFYERKISRIFDLKGSMRNRRANATGQQSEVLLDENLMEIIGESPLYIREHCKKLLRASLWNDTLFLSKLNVMDYSLLVGMDEERHELVVGIVDFIRTFTWDKKLESWVKETVMSSGGREPTIISPHQYKTRFRESMERYFLMVPDKYSDPPPQGQRATT